MGIKHLGTDSSTEQILEILDRDAGVIIDNILSEDQIKTLIQT